MKNIIFAFSLFLISAFNIGKIEGIIRGSPAGNGFIKYQVSIQVENEQNVHVCSGTILDSKHIMTVASCFTDQNGQFINRKYRIVAGEVALKGNPISEQRTVVPVDKIFLHANHVPMGISLSDIAVLELTQYLNLDPYSYVDKVELVTTKFEKSPRKFDGVKIVSGYGVSNQVENHFGRSTQNICKNQCTDLRYSHAEIVSDYICNDYLPSNNNDNLFCAKVLPRDNILKGNCFGDLGNPLVVDNKLIGILVKHRMDCDENGSPAVYLRISKFIDFIKYAQKTKKSWKPSLVRVAAYNSRGILEEIK